ncbi:hypothetical protein AMECASPLE_014757 [Ameca splendens]|uniref:Uncharacterized protein n=1 Tax=Ameca splendens TaxID=208324 RepID=A0ABV0Y1W6_9TELE
MHNSIPQASDPSFSAPSSPQPSTSSQGLPPYRHPAQPPLHPPLHRPAKPSGASGPATSAGCSVADQDPVSRLLISCSATLIIQYMCFNTEIFTCCVLYSSTFFQAPVLGPDGDKVQDLAEYLVSLRQALYLDEQQDRGHPPVNFSS